jgi:hypothetical protein
MEMRSLKKLIVRITRQWRAIGTRTYQRKKALEKGGNRKRMKKGKAEKDSKREREVVVP